MISSDRGDLARWFSQEHSLCVLSSTLPKTLDSSAKTVRLVLGSHSEIITPVVTLADLAGLRSQSTPSNPGHRQTSREREATARAHPYCFRGKINKNDPPVTISSPHPPIDHDIEPVSPPVSRQTNHGTRELAPAVRIIDRRESRPSDQDNEDTCEGDVTTIAEDDHTNLDKMTLETQGRDNAASPWLQYHLGQSSAYADVTKRLNRRTCQNGLTIKAGPGKNGRVRLPGGQHTLTLTPSSSASKQSVKSRSGSSTQINHGDYFWLSSGLPSKSNSQPSTPRSASRINGSSGTIPNGQQVQTGRRRGAEPARAKAIRNRLLGTTRSEFGQVPQPKRNGYLDKLYPHQNVHSDVLFLKIGDPSSVDYVSLEVGIPNRDLSNGRIRQYHSAGLSRTYQSTEVLYQSNGDPEREVRPQNRVSERKQRDQTVTRPDVEDGFFVSESIKSEKPRFSSEQSYLASREVSADSITTEKPGSVPPPSPILNEQGLFSLRRHASMVDLRTSSGLLTLGERHKHNSVQTNKISGMENDDVIETVANRNKYSGTDGVFPTEYRQGPVKLGDLTSKGFSSIMHVSEGDYLSISSDSRSRNCKDSINHSDDDVTSENDRTQTKRSVRFNLDDQVHEYEPWDVDGTED